MAEPSFIRWQSHHLLDGRAIIYYLVRFRKIFQFKPLRNTFRKEQSTPFAGTQAEERGIDSKQTIGCNKRLWRNKFQRNDFCDL
jgi:hypothetical protein